MQNITPKNDDERFMLAALDEARAAAERDEVPIGAVVVCQGRIIARAHNLTETLTDVTAHAEMQAITSAAAYLGGKYLTDCTLYVTVEPCLMCAGIWRCRRQARLSHLLRRALPQEDANHSRSARSRVLAAYDRLLSPQALVAQCVEPWGRGNCLCRCLKESNSRILSFPRFSLLLQLNSYFI